MYRHQIHSPSSESADRLLDRRGGDNLLPQHIAGLEAADGSSLEAAGSDSGCRNEES